MTKSFKKKSIVFLFIAIIVFPLIALSQKSHTLYRIFDEKVKSGNLKIDKAQVYFNQFKNSQNDQAIEFTSKILAQCYLGLGEIDSAKKYIGISLLKNKLTNDTIALLFSKMTEANIAEAEGKRTNALSIYYKALEKTDSLTDYYILTKLYQNIGNLLIYTGHADSALLVYQKAFFIASKASDTLLTASCLRSIGNYYYSTSNYGQAIKYQKYSLALEKAFGKSPTLGKSLLNLGVAFSECGKKNDAKQYLKESISILAKKNDKIIYSWALYNLGTIYFGLNQLDSALLYNNLSKEIFEKHQIPDGIARTNFMEGEILYSKKKYSEALKKYTIAEKIFIEDDSPDQVATVYNRIGSTYLDMKEYANAEKYFLLSYNLSKETAYNHMIKENVSGLALVYEYTHNFPKAYAFLRIEKNIHDSIFSEKSDSIAAEMNARFDSERKLLRIQVLGQENTIKSEKLKQNTFILLGLVVAFVIFALFGFLMFRQSKLKSSLKNLQLDQKLLRSQMNPHFLFNALATIQGYMQENNPMKASVYLSEFSKLMRAILESSINDDIPLDKEEEIINTYLYLQKVRFNHKFDYTVNVISSVEKDWVMVPPMLVQPFVENAVEYGMKNINYPGRIAITYEILNGYMNVCVEDNGPGLSAGNSKTTEHRSRATKITQQRLNIIKKRFRKNVVFTIENKTNNMESGVKVFLSIPIEID